ncbi:MAG: WG repeat-containing protein [Oscillospiraceae bacterium]|nr:WG repeat-containing protein [Oscillospiraceae bacterium]
MKRYAVLILLCITGMLFAGCSKEGQAVAKAENTLFQEGMIPFSDGGYWGFLDKDGNIAINPNYDDVRPFSDGLARVGISSDDKMLYGFIDKDANMVIDTQFDWVSYFHDGIAFVEENGYIGAIDKDGSYVINPQYEPGEIALAGSYGFILIDSGNGYSNLYDKNGEKISDERYADLEEQFMPGYVFSSYESSSTLMYDRYSAYYEKEIFPLKKPNGNWSYINEKGVSVLDVKYDRAYKFSEGFAMIGVEKGNGDDKKTKYGYIDEKGKEVISPQFDHARDFSEGIAVVGMAKKGETYSYSCGYIDTDGKYVINLKYDWAYDFFDGTAVVEKGDKYDLIDKSGQSLLDNTLDALGSCSSGCLLFKSDGKYGYIDPKGQVLIANKFNWSSRFFDDGYALYADDEKKIGIIDRSGEMIWNKTYDSIWGCGDFCIYEGCYETKSYKSDYCSTHDNIRREQIEKSLKDGTFIEGKWQSEDGSITLTCKKGGDNASVTVEDHGMCYVYTFHLFEEGEGFGMLDRNGSTEYFVSGLALDIDSYLSISRRHEDGFIDLYPIGDNV